MGRKWVPRIISTIPLYLRFSVAISISTVSAIYLLRVTGRMSMKFLYLLVSEINLTERDQQVPIFSLKQFNILISPN